ncbi:flavin reductase family protein [Actinomadura viridis]|uniref:Flavin reductase (DIM6/NTAB) family NADH-FMN oxidoreductase RutF n=1 Tax=Actinomadura viridis TaxID=58110 RepID=A0A931DK65_9ACTN|nr:flavin reductase family protein [Actinomadura viridis]MBG6089056.1 flavin reductase (DIM6/NTAB) family NADH-FMN oxidoreductase RutF [Actinomadura viridis]
MTDEPHRPPDPRDPAPPAPEELRRALGAFATGVTVITALEGGEPVGFACQSFTSVSLDPPLVLFCADHRGRTWPRIRAAGRFCVNVLGADQEEVCRRFGSKTGGKFQGLEWDRSRWGAPALRGVLARVHAEVREVHLAGDHDVVIGRVLEVETADGGRPMIFFRSGFGIDRPETAAPPPDDLWAWGDHWG